MPFRAASSSQVIEGLAMAAETPPAFRVAVTEGEDDDEMDATTSAEIHRPDVPDAEDAQDHEDPQDKIAQVIAEHDLNQLYVAFTATPSPATIQLFGEPFDTYTEAEAIAEGYIGPEHNFIQNALQSALLNRPATVRGEALSSRDRLQGP